MLPAALQDLASKLALAKLRSSLREGPAVQHNHGGGVVGLPGTVQHAVEQPSAAVHPQEAAAVITEAQAGIPEIPAAIPEDRPVLADDRPAMPAIANQVHIQLAICIYLNIPVALAV